MHMGHLIPFMFTAYVGEALKKGDRFDKPKVGCKRCSTFPS